MNNLKVEISFEHPLIHTDHPQIIYIQVLDEIGNTIQGANVSIVIVLPDGSDKASLLATCVSTYALIDCCVAKCASLSDT